VVKSRRTRWGQHVTCIWESINAHKISVLKPRHKWEDNIRMYGDWVYLAQAGWSGGLIQTWYWTFWFHKGGNFLTDWATIMFSRRTPLHGHYIYPCNDFIPGELIHVNIITMMKFMQLWMGGKCSWDWECKKSSNSHGILLQKVATLKSYIWDDNVTS